MMSPKFAVLGEALIDLTTEDGSTFDAQPGGSPRNLAVSAANQGVEVAFLAPFSNDAFGQLLRQDLASFNVTTVFPRESVHPSSLAVVQRSTITPTYTLYRDGVADLDWSADELVRSLPVDLDLFHTGSLALLPDSAQKMQRVLSIVTSANTPISVDVNIRDVSSADAVAYRDNVLAICRCATIVKASDEDLRFLFPDIDAITAARYLYQTLPEYSICLLTLGADGVVALSPHGEIACAAERPRAIVDTIGAGDTYFGVFFGGLV